MANTFSQMYVQLVFSPHGREPIIKSNWEERLFQYITGIIQNKGQKLLAINGMPDHIHIFIGMKPDCNLSALVREIKKASTEFINENKLTPFKFRWQEGFGSFTYGQSQIDAVVKYILNQKEHHKKTSFREEYVQILEEYKVEYNEKYLFEFNE